MPMTPFSLTDNAYYSPPGQSVRQEPYTSLRGILTRRSRSSRPTPPSAPCHLKLPHPTVWCRITAQTVLPGCRSLTGETTSASILGTSADRRIQTAITWNIPILKIITLSTRRPSHTGRTLIRTQGHPTTYASAIPGCTPARNALSSSAACGEAYTIA